ncbi:MAG: hypothetical protein JST00_43995 [Deltaproteobacteria bacterium]|nr:hypothetical protein [Deltaproteobacteria bacterium]
MDSTTPGGPSLAALRAVFVCAAACVAGHAAVTAAEAVGLGTLPVDVLVRGVTLEFPAMAHPDRMVRQTFCVEPRLFAPAAVVVTLAHALGFLLERRLRRAPAAERLRPAPGSSYRSVEWEAATRPRAPTAARRALGLRLGLVVATSLAVLLWATLRIPPTIPGIDQSPTVVVFARHVQADWEACVVSAIVLSALLPLWPRKRRFSEAC